MAGIICIRKQPPMPYPQGYYPRKFRFKEDAQQAVDIIKSEGGEAMMDYSVNIRMPDDPPLLTLVSTTKQ